MPSQMVQPKPHVEYLVGPQQFGPQHCIMCRQPFQLYERWLRVTSLPDSGLATYTIGVHIRCAKKGVPHD